jgi:hypothetical protein
MFKENDFVKATRDLSNHVLEGDQGLWFWSIKNLQ